MISPEIAEARCADGREAEVQPTTDWIPLGELCTIQIGRTPARADSRQWDPQRLTGNVWVSIADMSASETLEISSSKEHLSDLGAASGRIVPAGTILLSFKLSIGKIAVAGCDLYTNEAIAALLLPDDAPVSREFLVWFLRSVDWEKEAAGSDKVKGATLNKKKLSGLMVPVPPASEQQRIAAVLDRTSGIVAKYSQKLEEVQIRQSELRRAHIDALLGSLDARSESLAEVCDVFTDGDWIESKDQSPAGIRLIQTGNIGNGVFRDRLEKARWISPATFDRLRCTELLPGDVVFSRLPEPVGRACLIPETGTKMITAVDCTVARPNESVLLPRFLLLYASSAAYFREVQSMVTGTTRDRISRKNLGRVRIPIPSIATQQELLSAADRAEAGFVSLESSVERGLQCAEELSAAVLAAAFRGDL